MWELAYLSKCVWVFVAYMCICTCMGVYRSIKRVAKQVRESANFNNNYPHYTLMYLD